MKKLALKITISILISLAPTAILSILYLNITQDVVYHYLIQDLNITTQLKFFINDYIISSLPFLLWTILSLASFGFISKNRWRPFLSVLIGIALFHSLIHALETPLQSCWGPPCLTLSWYGNFILSFIINFIILGVFALLHYPLTLFKTKESTP